MATFRDLTHLHQVPVWCQSHRSSFRHILRKVKQRIPFMVFADLDEVIGTGIGKEIYPLFGIPGIHCEVLDKVVVHDVGSVCLQVVIIYIRWIVRSLIQPPPVPVSSLVHRPQCEGLFRRLPFRVVLFGSRVTPAGHRVDPPVDENTIFSIVVPAW